MCHCFKHPRRGILRWGAVYGNQNSVLTLVSLHLSERSQPENAKLFDRSTLKLVLSMRIEPTQNKPLDLSDTFWSSSAGIAHLSSLICAKICSGIYLLGKFNFCQTLKTSTLNQNYQYHFFHRLAHSLKLNSFTSLFFLSLDSWVSLVWAVSPVSYVRARHCPIQ